MAKIINPFQIISKKQYDIEELATYIDRLYLIYYSYKVPVKSINIPLEDYKNLHKLVLINDLKLPWKCSYYIRIFPDAYEFLIDNSGILIIPESGPGIFVKASK